MERRAVGVSWIVGGLILVLGVLADRSLVGQADALVRQAALEARQGIVSAINEALVQLEGSLHEPASDVTTLAIFPPPPLRFGPPADPPYAQRTPAQIKPLLDSTELTPAGIPKAVVAAAALGRPQDSALVANRLLSGELPVRPGDLAALTVAIGHGGDPRVGLLAEILASAPVADDLPRLPRFRRTVDDEDRLQGWSRGELRLTHYSIRIDDVLARAGIDLQRATEDAPAAARIHLEQLGGIALAADGASERVIRLRWLRVALWLAILTTILAVMAQARAVSRQRLALARERAFLANVTHELKTPLASIRVFGENLVAGRGDPKAYGELMVGESERLTHLVDQVLATTRLAERPELAKTDVAELVAATVSLVEESARQRGVSLRVAVTSDLPPVQWNREDVRRALLNLVDNALKHGPQEGEVTIRGRRVGGEIHIDVEDSGSGPDRQQLKQIFRRFERGDSRAAGTGLGLHLVELIARSHGGRVDLTVGDGCRFSLILPITPPHALEETP